MSQLILQRHVLKDSENDPKVILTINDIDINDQFFKI